MAAKKKDPPQLEALFADLLQAVKKESDRALAMILASWLDDALEAYLKASTVSDEKAVNDLFGVDRPLGTFSARINAAYLFGLIGKHDYIDLHIIRSIRNDFAHERGSISFRSQSIADRCRRLTAVQKHRKMDSQDVNPLKTPRDEFILAGILLTSFFMTAARTAQRPLWSSEAENRHFQETADAITRLPKSQKN